VTRTQAEVIAEDVLGGPRAADGMCWNDERRDRYAEGGNMQPVKSGLIAAARKRVSNVAGTEVDQGPGPRVTVVVEKGVDAGPPAVAKACFARYDGDHGSGPLK